MITRDEFLYPRSRYRGQMTPEHLVFNANLQEFSQRITFICNLQTNGKISVEESYLKIKALWWEFEFASQQLKIVEPFSNQSKD